MKIGNRTMQHMNTYKALLGIYALLIAGCTVEQPEPSVAFEQKEITITAYRSDESGTKTQRDESNGAVLWTPGDAISLFYGSGAGGGSKFVSNASEPAAVTNFTGSIGVITGGADVSVDDTFFWGLYPYDPAAECDGSSVVTTLPNRQKAVPGTFDTGLFPSLGKAQGLSMGFYNICGGIRFTVTKSGLKSVTLRALGGESLTGKAKIGFVDGTPKVLEIMDGSDMITLSAPAGKYLEVGKFYYFITFPQALSEGIELTFNSFSETGSYERRTSSLKINRSVFGTLRNVDQNVVYAKRTGDIPIEDPVFKDYLVPRYDSDNDGEISIEEAEAVTEIRIDPTNEYNLQSLSGIEYMPNLEVISCPGDWYDTADKSIGVQREHYYVGPYKDTWDYAWGPIGTLKYIDVSNNPKLKELDIRQNSALGVEVGTIDLSNNKALEVLNIDFTWLEYPDISENTELRIIRFCHLRGEIPDISSHTKAVNINIDFPLNQRTEIHDFDVSGMPDLENLELRGIVRNISNLSENKKLRYVSIAHSNHFSGELNVSGCQELEGLQCMCSNISSLDLSNNTKLKDLACELNHLTELDLSANTQLKVLHCYDNRISSLKLPDSLEQLLCWNNPIGSLDVSGMTELYDLACANTGLTKLDVSANAKLKYLAFNDNDVKTIDLSGNPLLEELACWNCGLGSLDVSHNPNLTWLRCWGNSIAVLDVSRNPKLGTRTTGGEHENGLSCSPMNDNEGNNLLKSLFVKSNQVIPFVTRNRSTEHIPAQTNIYYVDDPLPIEDPAFKAWLVSNFDTDGNGQISYAEAERITQIWLSPSNEINLQSLQGIEYMPNLEVLCCIGEWYNYSDGILPIDKPYYYIGPYRNGGPIGTINKVDVSNNPKLRLLNLANNSALGVEMETIDLSHNPLLEELCLNLTYLNYPDIKHNPRLRDIQLSGLRGNMPDFSSFTELRRLNIEYPQDAQNQRAHDIDVSKAPHLECLIVSDAARSLSDLSLNPELKELHYPYCPEVGLVDLSKLVKLEALGLAGNGITSIDLSVLSSLKRLHIDHNALIQLDLTSNTQLWYLDCNCNNLSELNLSGLSSLREIYCDGNPLTALDISRNGNLEALGFSGTQICNIDVSNNSKITIIGCENIPGLNCLDLSKNVNLQKLFINGDGFTSIDISNNTKLEEFGCRGNKISTLNVSNNRLLKELSCVQQNRPDGKNYLQTLYIAGGQSIPHITVDRSIDYIPAETIITTAPQSGGGEGTGDEDWN